MLRLALARFVGWLLLALFALQTTGCHSWKPTAQPWPQSIASKPGARYRIVTAGGQYHEVDTIQVVGDSLFGVRRNLSQVGLALSQVSRVEERRFDGGKTALLVGGIVVGLVGLVYWAGSTVGGVEFNGFPQMRRR